MTAGKKEGSTRGAEDRRRGQEDHQDSEAIGKREREAGLRGDKKNKEQRPRRRSEGDTRVKEEEGARDTARGEKRAAGCAVRAGREVTAGCWRWRGQNQEEHLSVQVAAAAAVETVAAAATAVIEAAAAGLCCIRSSL